MKREEVNLFVHGSFKLNSGLLTDFKIDCDALSEEDIATLAMLIARRVGEFNIVIGIPSGGARLAAALTLHRSGPFQTTTLIVDDVLTTGASMDRARDSILESSQNIEIKGAVIFARGKCPDWITPLFTMTVEATP